MSSEHFADWEGVEEAVRKGLADSSATVPGSGYIGTGRDITGRLRPDPTHFVPFRKRLIQGWVDIVKRNKKDKKS